MFVGNTAVKAKCFCSQRENHTLHNLIEAFVDENIQENYHLLQLWDWFVRRFWTCCRVMLHNSAFYLEKYFEIAKSMCTLCVLQCAVTSRVRRRHFILER